MNTKVLKSDIQKKDCKRKRTILFVELIGTFLLVGGILLPGAIGVSLPNTNAAGEYLHTIHSDALWNTLNWVFEPLIFKAFYVAALIFVLVFIFIKWSANFNPVVTLSEIAAGNDTYKFGFKKIAAQFIGAFIAVYFMALVVVPAMSGEGMEEAFAMGYSLDGTQPIFIHFNYDSFAFTPGGIYQTETLQEVNDWWYWFVQMFMEFLLTFLLIMSVFYGGDKYSKTQRIFIISGTVWAILIVGLRFNTIALNPARLVAPAFVSNQFGVTAPMNFVWIYLIGELLAFALFNHWVKKQRFTHEETLTYKQNQYLKELLAEKKQRRV